MNPFETLNHVQEIYKTYVYTFQKIRNSAIQKWVQEKIAEGTLLWKDPYIQLNRRFKRGESLQKLVDKTILHKNVLTIFSKKDPKNLKQIMSLNKAFHKNLYRYGDTQEAFDIYERYEGLLTTLRHKYGFHSKRQKEMVVEHSEILKALSSKDALRAEKLVKMHIEKAMGDILSFLDEKNSGDN